MMFLARRQLDAVDDILVALPVSLLTRLIAAHDALAMEDLVRSICGRWGCLIHPSVIERFLLCAMEHLLLLTIKR